MGESPRKENRFTGLLPCKNLEKWPSPIVFGVAEMKYSF